MSRIADPMEAQIRDALNKGKHWFTEDQTKTNALDFKVMWGTHEVFIEVKQFHSERISDQMSRELNVIAVQGKGAVQFMADLLKRFP